MISLLRGLNKQQRQAVTCGDGPLLIIAGAGTGKTKVITHRIAWLIAEKKCQPDEILALTFTDKAATEMEDRVFDLLPLGQATMQIATFHAFGDRLLREHSYDIGLPPTFTVMAEPQQVLLLREHLFDLPLKTLRPRGNPTRHLADLARVFSRAKDEGVPPEAYQAWVKKEVARVGKLKNPARRAEVREWLTRQREIAACYAFYEERKRDAQLLDYGDQVFLALQLLKQSKRALTEARKRYKYVLVDEFQDTNVVQNELVNLITRKNGNLTVVGDDDQSIYRFRGASLGNILDFEQTHPKSARVLLTKNYRSTQPVLDAAYRLIQGNNPNRLEVQDKLDKRLKANVAGGPVRTGRPGGSPVSWQKLQTAGDEADAVADTIAAGLKQGKRPSDFAILIRTVKRGEAFRQALSVHDIPAVFEGTGHLYDRPEIRMCLAFLRLTVNPLQSGHLSLLLASPIYQMPDDDLFKLQKHRARTHDELWELLPAMGEEAYSAAGVKAGERLRADLEKFSELRHQCDAGQLLYRWLADHTGYLKAVGQQKDAAQALIVANLARFFDRIVAFTDTAGDKTAVGFVDYFDEVLRVADEPQASEIDAELDAVKILTVHKAKGLEFDTVFVAASIEGEFPTKPRGEQLKLPDALYRHLPEEREHEERCLYYVAMTRARQRLLLTAAADYGGKRLRKVSRFVSEALGDEINLTEETAPNPLTKLQRHRPPAPGLAVPYVAPDPLELSFTSINAYLTCPLKYFWNHVVKAYVEPNHTLLFGDLMHVVIQEFNTSRMHGQPLSLKTVLARYDKVWRGSRYLSKVHERDAYERGRQAVKRFRAAELKRPVPAAIEDEFKFKLANCLVKGRYDRIDRTDGKVVLLDYKTGQVLSQRKANERAAREDQLTLYALALYQTTGEPPDEVQLSFLESGLVGTSTRSMRKIENMEKKIETVAGGIKRGDFTPNPASHECAETAFNFCPGNTLTNRTEL